MLKMTCHLAYTPEKESCQEVRTEEIILRGNLTRNANGGNTSSKGYPWKVTFRNRIHGLNIQVRIGVKREPRNTTGIAKFNVIIIRIFNELVPCNATSITREKTRLNGIR